MMIGASLRGLPISMFEEMTPGAIVDYCIEYNNIMGVGELEKIEREATQEDFDRF